MKPDDRSGHLPAEQRPFRVLLIAGSDRRQYNCPGVDDKARTLMMKVKEQRQPGRAPGATPCRGAGAAELVTELVAFVERKGKVPPGRHRAFGYRPPRHVWADLKLAWREVRMRTGHPPPGSSPALQQQQGLNRDVTLRPGKSEGEKERERE